MDMRHSMVWVFMFWEYSLLAAAIVIAAVTVGLFWGRARRDTGLCLLKSSQRPVRSLPGSVPVPLECLASPKNPPAKPA
jgi:hypothetical protein